LPAQPAYFHRLSEALEVFRSLDLDWIDRRTLQETLGVSKTVAWRILRLCGASDGPGNTIVCRRMELISALERLAQSDTCDRELHRRSRLEQNLAQLLRTARASHIQVAPHSRSIELVSSRFGKLSAGVDLSPSRLVIDFHGTEDFLEKVGAIVFALQNDYEAVSEFIEANRD
jgi:hypothetical protein